MHYYKLWALRSPGLALPLASEGISDSPFLPYSITLESPRAASVPLL